MKRARWVLWLPPLLAAALVSALLWFLALRLHPLAPAEARWLGYIGLGLPVLGALLAHALDRRILGGLAEVARRLDLAVLPAAHPSDRPAPPLPAPVDLLRPPLERLIAHMDQLRSEIEEERQRATAELESERRRLAAILQDLAEGLFCCALDGRILLYNEAAVTLLGAPPALGLGRSLYQLLAQRPVVHHLRELRRRAATQPARRNLSEPFLCTTTGGERLLRCRLGLVGGGAEGFVLVFEDVSAALREATAERFLDQLETVWRGPLGSLRAAAELLQEEVGGEEGRGRFLRVLLEESARLETALQELAQAGRRFMLGQWPLHDVSAADLADALLERIAERGAQIELAFRPPSLWFRGDSFVLTELLAAFAAGLHAEFGADRFTLSSHSTARGVALDLAWRGAVPGQRWFEHWLDRPLLEGTPLRPRELLARHGCLPWIAPSPGEEGGFLRLELPPPGEVHARERREPLPPRPEFYDFRLLSSEPGARREQPLRRLAFTVFDTETTGLDPKRDEIIQLAGVRVLHGRLLRGECFDALIDPGRPIPPDSTRFHGITDEMVRGRPPAAVVLARFHAFVGDDVLVAHNAAFDLAFLRKHEAEAGVRFDNPALDTLLLSALLDEFGEDHSLDALAERLGVPVRGRHTALGDAFTTAEVFVRLLGLLEARGLRTLGQVLDASREVARLRERLAHDRAGESRGDGIA